MLPFGLSIDQKQPYSQLNPSEGYQIGFIRLQEGKVSGASAGKADEHGRKPTASVAEQRGNNGGKRSNPGPFFP